MENPKYEIQHVVRSLCQGTADEQRRTLDRYFTPDAEFVHPFCVAPRFNRGGLRYVPLLNRLSSRDVVRGIYQWYRMLSPKIELEFDAVLFDRARDKVFLDIRQNFSVWFFPLYHAKVRLVTVLDLVACDPAVHDEGEPLAIKQEGDEDASGAGSGYYDEDERAPVPGQFPSSSSGVPAQRLWRISRQEDLYQVNEFLKFVGPYWWCFWRLLWLPFQVGAAVVCVFLSLFVALSPWAFQKVPAAGGVESTIDQIDAYYDYDLKHGKSNGRGSKSRTPSTPPHKHSKGRKKNTR